VNGSTEVIDVAERRPVEAEAPTDRRAAFLRLADHHLDSAYRLARAILRDAAEAEDATHDAFVQAWQKWGTLHDAAAFEHWFDRILVNTCRNRLQARARRRATDISVELTLTTRDQIGPSIDRQVLGDAVSSLSPDQRVVIALRYFMDLPIDEISRRLGIPSGTVQSRLHYALKRLHSALDAAEVKGTTR
jgi:RNA polymerase sigma-70 factor (ECF subfamily)